MVDYISAKNYKILSDKELIEWQNETKNKIKELQNRLLNINRAIKNRKIGNIDMENKQMKCIKIAIKQVQKEIKRELRLNERKSNSRM